MEQYLIDTNVVSDYFSASFDLSGMNFMDGVMNSVPNISVITQIELLCWKTSDATSQNVSSFVKDSVIFNIDTDIVEQRIEIRKNKKIKTPDAIIAATALTNNYTLVTNNEKDFAGIPRLKLVNPHKI